MIASRKFKDPGYWGKIAAGVTFFLPGVYLLDLSQRQVWGMVFLFTAARIAIDADATETKDEPT